MKSLPAIGVLLLAVSACSRVASSGLPEPVSPQDTAVPAQTPPTTADATSPTQQGRPAVETGLVGSVVLATGSALGGIGGSGSKPVAGAKVIVSQREGGQEITSTLSDSAGHFEVSLPPGTYRVTLESGVSPLFTKDLPATITVTKGKTATLNVLLDTGIR